MKRKRLLLSVAALLILVMVVGCGKETANPSPVPTKSNEPVTLRVFLQAAVSDEDFKLLFTDPVKKKYPYITLEVVRPVTGSKIDDLITAGFLPDLMTTTDASILGFTRQDLLYDIAPLVKKHNMDLNRFEAVAIDAVRSDKGELWGIPYAMEFNTTYYNKDIFDKFGVGYPKDGMTWDDAIALGKKVTTNGSGDSQSADPASMISTGQYRGLDVINSNIMSFPFALTYVNGKTNKASINNDQWKRVFELTKQIQTIPGNQPPDLESGLAKIADAFVKDRNIAMMVGPNAIKYFSADQAGLNWDMAQYPSHKEIPNVSGKVDSHNLAITKTSKYKDDAMKVLEVVTSDEVQLLNVRKTGRVSPLKNPEMQKQFGADMPILKGKNIQAIFKSKVVAPPIYSVYESDGKKIGQQKFKDYLTGPTDVNSALRQAEDEINKMLSTQMAK